MTDQEGAALQFAASVVWTSLGQSQGDGIMGYRAGVTFLDADRERVAAFCQRNRRITAAPPLAASTESQSTPADEVAVPVEARRDPEGVASGSAPTRPGRDRRAGCAEEEGCPDTERQTGQGAVATRQR